MYRHGPLAAQGRLLPDRLIEHLGGKHLAGIRHQQMQYGIFRGGQGHGFPLHRNGFRPVIQGDAADGDVAGGGLRAAAQMGIAPQLRTHPGQHLHGNEGLGNIIIRPHIQPQHLILGFGFGGKQNNRGVGKFPDPGGGGDAVHDRHHHIQQNQVDVVVLDNVQGLLASVSLEQAVPLRGQVNLQRIDDIRLIVADQNVIHSRSPLSVFSEGIILIFNKKL